MPLFDMETTEAVITEDLETGFRTIFEPLDSPSPVGVFAEAEVGADNVSVLAWEWRVRHVGPLQGTPATGREVTLRGVTVIDGRGADPQFSRYIDWLALYAELGAVTIARPPVDDRKSLPVEDNVPFPAEPADPGS